MMKKTVLGLTLAALMALGLSGCWGGNDTPDPHYTPAPTPGCTATPEHMPSTTPEHTPSYTPENGATPMPSAAAPQPRTAW